MINAQTPGEPPAKANRFRRLTAFVPVLLLVICSASAQSPRQDSVFKQPDGDTIARPVFVGLFGGQTFSGHSASIADEISCDLGIFSDARTRSVPLGVFFDFPTGFDPSVRVTTRFTYTRFAVTLPGTLYSFRYLRNEGVPIEDTAVTQTELTTEFQTNAISVAGIFEPIPIMKVGIGATVTAIMRSTERRTERYISPIDARFGDSLPIRTLPVENPLVFRPFIYSIDGVLGFCFPASRRLSLFPQVQFSVPLVSMVENADWRIAWQVIPTLGIGWDFSPEPQRPVLPPDPIQLPDPTPPRVDPPIATRPPILRATVVARGVDEQGREYDNPTIEIEEASWVEVVPVIPMIFFDSGSASIPRRYALLGDRERADRFSVDSLVRVTPIDIHWQSLNVFGRRLRDDPRIIATLVGTGSADERPEASGLATARARSVAQYLRDVWGIDSVRLRISSSPRPVVPSNEEREEGKEENRRVELRFSRPKADDPVLVRRLAAVASPPAVKFRPYIEADSAVAGWNIAVLQGEKELLRFEGSSAAATLAQSKLWPLTDLRINKDLTPIRYRLEVFDVTGQRATDSGTFLVQERVRQSGSDSNRRVELYGYNLVGFDYDSYVLLPRQRAELSEIARAASGQAQMTIVGYTDRVGDPERNRLLSLERARAVHDAIRAEQRRLGLPEANAVSVQGLGQREQVFDNDLPEGRILSRMALVTISKLRLK